MDKGTCLSNIFLNYKYSQTCELRALNGTWQCALSEQFSFIYRLQLYALFINEKNEADIYRQ